ncbi:MAG: response regulator [Candidatus Kryptoniota bacterium]
MIRVLIVDDHPIVRKGLRTTIQEQSDLKVVDEAKDSDEAVVKARSTIPDVVLLDLSMPGKGGLEVLRQLHSEMPSTKILILSTYPEKQYAIRCLRNGAVGYLTKERAPEELITAIRKVANGRKFVSSELAELLVNELDSDSLKMPHELLSEREFEVLCLLGRGKTVSQIADTLSLSLPTINTYRSRILEKMNMQTTAQLIHYVLENKLIDQVD